MPSQRSDELLPGRCSIFLASVLSTPDRSSNGIIKSVMSRPWLSGYLIIVCLKSSLVEI